MASSAMVKVLCVGLMGLALLAPQGDAAIPCTTVYNTLYPCVNYVMGTGPLGADCCNGIKTLYGEANTTPDRQSVCTCLKSIASNAGGSSTTLGKARSLPQQCGVNLPYEISPTIDCSK
ncbi:non-specific lipid-transfer protein 2-like [Coffea arabica]|uniref:Non-specific lipid-transfer protein n=2 Tax=Coffea TaxID=13442 RepID=A0A6P6XGM9_COFAR